MYLIYLFLISTVNSFSLKSIINPYNYYILAVQNWCSDDYKIHGLWPQYNHNKWPSFCEKLEYKKPSGELLEDMRKYWDTCDNEDLWKHEWEKHGSCIEKNLGWKENEYFEKTLELFKKNINVINENCDGQKNCYNNCFDLDFNKMECP